MDPPQLSAIVAYARVSTREQAENFNALEQQIARLKATEAQEILQDVDSGRDDDRPQFQRLMKAVRDGVVQKVIVTRLDRLTRSLPTLRRVLDDFQRSGGVLVALDDNIDVSTATGKFHVNLLGALAEMESDRLSERIRHGKKHFRNQRRTAHAGFGYKVLDFRLEPDTDPFLCTLDGQEWSKFTMALEVVQAYVRVQSLTETCRWFIARWGYQEFWGTALRAWLTRPTNRGHLTYYPKSKTPEIHYNTHEPLISEDEYQEISRILEFNRRVKGYGTPRRTYSLTGLVRCDVCGSSCVICNSGSPNKSGTRIKAFVCSKSRFKTCSSKKQILLRKLEESVINALVQKAGAIADLANRGAQQQESPKMLQLREQLATLESMAFNPVIEDAKVQLRLQIESLGMKQSVDDLTGKTARDLLLTVGSDSDFWATLSPDQKRRFFRALVDRVVVSHGKILRVDLKV